MRVFLSKSAVIIDDLPLAPRMNAAAMTALAGAPVSTRQIPLYPDGMRKAHVSPTGIVWWVDSPDGHVSHLQLALSPKDTPGEPTMGFTGSIRLNALDLSPDTSEPVFLRHGGVEVDGHAHSWAFRTADHFVSFAFERRRNRIGKRSGVHRLAFVEIDFARGSEQAASPNGGSAEPPPNSGVGGGSPSVS